MKPLVQVIQGDVELEQVQLQDWEEEASEDEGVGWGGVRVVPQHQKVRGG
jgi:hypothetical protein